MVLKGYFYVVTTLCRLYDSKIFGERAVFGMDAYHIFPQGRLALVPLIGCVFGVVVCRACISDRASSLLCGCHKPVRDRVCSSVVVEAPISVSKLQCELMLHLGNLPLCVLPQELSTRSANL